MEDLVVRTDTGKLVSISVAYLILGAIGLYLGVAVAKSVPVAALCYVFSALTVFGIVHNVRQIMSPRVLFKADSAGVTDYSKEDDIAFAPWDRIERIDLKAANNEALMLDVIAYKTLDELGELSDEDRQMAEANGGRGYYLLELSGIWVSRSRIQRAFDDISVLAARYNPEIPCVGFQDSLAAHSKKGRERLERQQRLRERAVRERLASEEESRPA